MLTDREKARELTRKIEALVGKADLHELDSMLETADMDSLSVYEIAALIRWTAFINHRLPAWEAAYTRACRSLLPRMTMSEMLILFNGMELPKGSL